MIEAGENLEKALFLHQNNKLNEAEKLYKNLLTKEPDNINLMYFLSLLLLQTSRGNEANAYLKKILELKPEGQLLVDSYNLLGEINLNKNDFNNAEKYFLEAANEDQSDLVANFNLGKVYLSLKNYDKSIEYSLKALRAETNQTEIYQNLIEAYSQKNNIDSIINCYLKLLEIDPSNASYYFSLGTFYLKKGDAENTFKSYLNAVYLKPDFLEAHINLGELYHRSFNFQYAEKHFTKGLELNENLFEVYLGLGNVYVDMGETAKVIDISQKGLKKFPGNSSLLFNIARAQFLEGNIDKGWEYFKLRRTINEKKGLKTYLLDYKGDLKDKKVLVYWDSGYGDSIQFIRYIPLLKEKGAKVLLKIQEPLRNLIESSNFDVEILPENQKLEETEHDFQINLTSLTYLFKTEMDNFHFKDKYLKADPEKVQQWKEKYFDNNDFKVGIVWYSHVNLFRKNIDSVKEFYNISKIPGIKLYSIQQTKGKPMLENLPEDFNLVHLGDELKDFSDTAAIVENLDLLIAIDTAPAHLAGAMGKPVYCMLPDIPNWRWFMSGENCPWYDSMKLFRQKEAGNWKEVLERIEKDLLV